MLKNRLVFIGIIVSVMVLIVSLGVGLYIGYDISKISRQLQLSDEISDYQYHVMVILDDNNGSYSHDFVEGIDQGANRYGVAYEIIRVKDKHYDESVVDVLDMAIYSKVDGIVLHAYDDKDIIEKIDQATSMGIKVVTLNEDIPQSSRHTYVGINQYNLGTSVAKAIGNIAGNIGNVVVVDQRSVSNRGLEIGEYNDFMINGMEEVFKKSPGLKLKSVKYTEEGVLSAESIALDILKSEEKIDVIFCTNEVNTLGIIQVLIDKNKVNDYILVGFGDDEELFSYLKKNNILESTVVTDYKAIGNDAIKAFYEAATEEIYRSYLNTDIQIINKENVESYQNEQGVTNEKD